MPENIAEDYLPWCAGQGNSTTDPDLKLEEFKDNRAGDIKYKDLKKQGRKTAFSI